MNECASKMVKNSEPRERRVRKRDKDIKRERD
jgi:hypothetical protein